MVLTKEQQALLDGEKGETMAKVMKTLVMYGEAFGAERMVPVTSKYGHTVISFGIGVMKPIYELYDTLLEAGAVSKQPFSADPRPLDKNVPSSFLQDIVFKFMYSQQERYESQLKHFGWVIRRIRAPVIFQRLVILLNAAKFCPGLSPRLLYMPTAFSERGATEIQVLLS